MLWVDRDRRSRRDRRARSRRTRSREDLRARARATSIPATVVDALRKLGTVKRIAGADAGAAPRSPSPATRRRRASAGTSSTRATASCSPTRAGRRTPPPPRRCRRTARTGRCCCSPTPACCPQPLQDYLLDIQPGYDERPGPRRLQPRLDHRRRERDRGRRPGAHRHAPGDPARRHRSRVSHGRSRAARTPARRTARSPSTTCASSWAPPRRTSRYQIRNRIAQPGRGPARRRPGPPLRGEREIARLESLGFTGEVRGDTQPGRHAARSPRVNDHEQPRRVPGAVG